ncbi:Pcc1-domain-containing protein [Aaosphaeria arxii CBS 175.79]|uniref:Pcc1-domain-containing protein n=1 Tax=Aaosphaeria arxii CBS 175.79 TaxID=1450172 RepID=A0A6A5XPR6_9PLEO|nr:Pcc1-domain-containing protein [Aaosphaeria arxii CBS 175.79]KAF2014933.1 Pcc1-domain-containing protein [Aaosphaeria arxii CBS 175.79]
MAASEQKQDDFPCKLAIDIPFPTASLASTALRALSVDKELSPLVRRTFASNDNVLRVNYEASTNRMLRVAVNGFFESVGVVVNVMKDLDVDVYDSPVTEPLDGVQGLVKG